MLIDIIPNKYKANQIKKAIRDNDGYCPCQIEKNKDTKCMCKNFRMQIESGFCQCGLYYKT